MYSRLRFLRSLILVVATASSTGFASSERMPGGEIQSKPNTPFRWFFDYTDLTGGKDLTAVMQSFNGIDLPVYGQASVAHILPDQLTVATDRVDGNFEIYHFPKKNRTGGIDSLAIDIFLQTRLSDQAGEVVKTLFPNADDRYPMAEKSDFTRLEAGNGLQVIWDESDVPKLSLINSTERVRVILSASELNEYRCLLDAHDELARLPQAEDEADHLSSENALSILMGKLVQNYRTTRQELVGETQELKWVASSVPYTLHIDNSYLDASGRSLHEVMLAIVKKYAPICRFQSPDQPLNEASFPAWTSVKKCAHHHHHNIPFLRR